MAGDVLHVPGSRGLTGEQVRRWTEVLDHLAAALPAGAVTVLVDGGPLAGVVADRLSDHLAAAGRPCLRLTDSTPPADAETWRAGRGRPAVALADGPGWRAHPPNGGWDVVIRLRTRPGGSTRQNEPAHAADGAHAAHAADSANTADGADSANAAQAADIVVDLRDPDWPVIRQLAERLAPRERWYVGESRAFFGVRAASWDARFGDDLPAYAAAVREARLPAGGVAVDVGCGTGRALPALRQAVGPGGIVIGLDLTPQMLAAAVAHGRDSAAALLIGDARHLPLRDATADVVFAAGLLTHLPDPVAGLRELARVTRPGGRLVIFHPSGRAALAARHGRVLGPEEPLAEVPLQRSALRAGWHLDGYDDAAHRFLAIATRRPD
ncbi:SAM-dependent methyltransferase [Plantactinospora sp. BC1]|uniref:class I SAM-dependent methyltransferase n=1 Tax=Plantactinospora sp. BC1 TaxID=2108470 RepID=UPI000D179699|nr:class I SAM-dependent methyltransferase [Plantactinospora sp. BC1]AVT28821.1 SAM-dependent methyltransferase [Plantactinospora sp. BC1]